MILYKILFYRNFNLFFEDYVVKFANVGLFYIILEELRWRLEKLCFMKN